MKHNIASLVIDFVENRAYLYDSDMVAGECDAICSAFLHLVESVGFKGKILCIGCPVREPDLGWKFYGFAELISHYVVLVDGVVLDFTARQFWRDSSVPMVYPYHEISKYWKDEGFGNDAREDLKLDLD